MYEYLPQWDGTRMNLLTKYINDAVLKAELDYSDFGRRMKVVMLCP